MIGRAIVLVLSLAVAASGQEEPIGPGDRNHWSFLPLKPKPPTVGDRGARNTIDAFVHKVLRAEGLAPLGEADRRTLLRRASFDLTGLPPAAADLKRFADSQRPDAFEREVDRLLASPAHGEHAAQYWLDLARFAETDGFEHDHVRPNAWRYRDWVIDAINTDLPYDEFVQAQLAGDLIRKQSRDSVIATGFLLCGPDMPDINLQEERRHNFLNDMTATVGSVFLGIRIGCAQCHDHRSDPISIHDFYRLRAFFEDIDLFKDHPLPRTDGPVQEKPGRGRVVRSGKPRTAWVRTRGDFRRRGDEVMASVPRVLTRSKHSHTSRLDLARWLTSSENPLARRVIANRIWQQHFGIGLAPTESDLGIVGDESYHPELLDWLAAELPRQEWSIKALRRVIVTSATYRRAIAEPGSKLQDHDPENWLLGRRTPRRLSGETLRDAMLAVAGSLNRTPGGPGVRPPLPKEIVSTVLRNHWPVSPDAADHHRRSVYLFVRRNLRYPLFDVFDRPDSNTSCARRNESTTAVQALMQLNSEFTAARAREIAAQTTDVNELFVRLLGRPATDAERQRIGEFLDASDQNTELLVLALLNSSEFVWID